MRRHRCSASARPRRDRPGRPRRWPHRSRVGSRRRSASERPRARPGQGKESPRALLARSRRSIALGSPARGLRSWSGSQLRAGGWCAPGLLPVRAPRSSPPRHRRGGNRRGSAPYAGAGRKAGEALRVPGREGGELGVAVQCLEQGRTLLIDLAAPGRAARSRRGRSHRSALEARRRLLPRECPPPPVRSGSAAPQHRSRLRQQRQSGKAPPPAPAWGGAGLAALAHCRPPITRSEKLE